MYQKILVLTTYNGYLRSEVIKQTCESGSSVYHNTDVQHVEEIQTNKYATPLNAMGDGWRLIGPPFRPYTDSGEHEWWFEKLE